MKLDVVRAWKDPLYRAGLSVRELEAVPSHPAGLAELTDAQLREASGVEGSLVTTGRTCTMFTASHKCC